MPLYIDIIIKLTPAFITLVLGSFGVYIAYQQHQTSREKLRLDLFQKRLASYENLQDYFNILIQKARVPDSAIHILSEARYESLFLFGEDVTNHIAQVWEKAFELKELHEQLDGSNSLPTGEERSQISGQAADLLKWNSDQQKTSPKRYEKYLKFGKT